MRVQLVNRKIFIRYDSIHIDTKTGVITFSRKGKSIGTIPSLGPICTGDEIDLTNLKGKFEVDLI